jgi:hypothetical protein
VVAAFEEKKNLGEKDSGEKKQRKGDVCNVRRQLLSFQTLQEAGSMASWEWLWALFSAGCAMLWLPAAASAAFLPPACPSQYAYCTVMRARPFTHPMGVQVTFNVTVTKGESSLVFECVSDGTYLDVRHVSHEPAGAPESETAYTGARAPLGRHCPQAPAAIAATAGLFSGPPLALQAS